MIERPTTHNQEAAEETGNRYLANLGFEWDDLKGKKVIDIGASSAEFEHAARERGIDVTSLDFQLTDEYMPPSDSRFVVANATKLPFKDESFDFAVAHMSVMNYREKDYQEKDYLLYIEDILRGACRILKPGGQFRFTDASLEDSELKQSEGDIVPDKRTDTYESWRIEREHKLLEAVARRAGFNELKLGNYANAKRVRTDDDKEDLTHYYIALKS